MTNNIREPDFNLPQDLQAFLLNELGICSCSEYEPLFETLKQFLEWVDSDNRPAYSKLFCGNVGAFYLISGIAERADLSTHGVSIRHPFLSEKGKELLAALRGASPTLMDGYEKAEAYDGYWYGGEVR